MRKDGKIQPLPEAIAALVKDGSFVSLEGFTHLISFAAGHELLRQGPTDLTVVRLTPDVAAAREPVDDLGGGGGRDPQPSPQLTRAEGNGEEVLEGPQLVRA